MVERMREDWLAYLEKLDIPQKAKVIALWKNVEHQVGSPFPVPHAGTGEDGNYIMEWGCPHLYADIEVFKDGSYECFYAASHEDYGGDEQPRLGPLPARFVNEMRHFLECKKERPWPKST